MAPKLGVSRVQVSRLRRGKHKPSLKLAVTLESLTGIPAWDWIRPDGGPCVERTAILSTGSSLKINVSADGV